MRQVLADKASDRKKYTIRGRNVSVAAYAERSLVSRIAMYLEEMSHQGLKSTIQRMVFGPQHSDKRVVAGYLRATISLTNSRSSGVLTDGSTHGTAMP